MNMLPLNLSNGCPLSMDEFQLAEVRAEALTLRAVHRVIIWLQLIVRLLGLMLGRQGVATNPD